MRAASRALRAFSADSFAAASTFARWRAAARARACFARAAAFAFATARLWAAAVAAREAAELFEEVDPELEDVEDCLVAPDEVPEERVEPDEVVAEERLDPDEVELDGLTLGFLVVVGALVVTGAGSGVGPVSAKALETIASAAALAASTLIAVPTAPQ